MNILRAFRLTHTRTDGYPFGVPAVRSLDRLDLAEPVTFFAGANGTGKSTLLEALALTTQRICIGGANQRAALASVEPLAQAISLEWGASRAATRRQGFFLRAEDFLEYKHGVTAAMAELASDAASISQRFTGYGRQLAHGALEGQRRSLVNRYGEDPDGMSHGESFLQFFRARFTGPGLYLLDEPDTALSPQSVLGLMSALIEMVGDGAQFVIATHHPMLLALPQAQLVSFDQTPPRAIAWDELEPVTLMKDFLRDPRPFLRHLSR